MAFHVRMTKKELRAVFKASCANLLSAVEQLESDLSLQKTMIRKAMERDKPDWGPSLFARPASLHRVLQIAAETEAYRALLQK